EDGIRDRNVTGVQTCALPILIRSQRIDLIQSHLLGPAVYGAVAAIACRVPQVATFHGQSDVSPHERFRRLKFALLGWAAGRVTRSEERRVGKGWGRRGGADDG